MPTAPLTSCATVGCPELVHGGRCPKHTKQREQWRGTKQQRGYGGTWPRLRLQILTRDPLCQIGVKCAHLPIHKRISTEVDHIIPIRVAPGRRLDETNLQGCCGPCNSWKRSQDEARWPSQTAKEAGGVCPFLSTT